MQCVVDMLERSPELTFPILCNAYLCHQLQRKCSIGNLVFSYGVVSPCKNLQTSVSVTRLIMGKDDRCQSTMDLTSSITSQYHHQSRKLPSPPMKIPHPLTRIKIELQLFLTVQVCQYADPPGCWSCLFTEDGSKECLCSHLLWRWRHKRGK